MSLILILAVLAVISGLFGFTGLYVAVSGVAKLLFYVFAALLVLSLVRNQMSKPKHHR